MGAQAALQAAQSISGSGGGGGGGVVGGGNMDEPKTVLRVIVEHMLYPVTIDILKQVCAFVVCCFTTFFLVNWTPDTPFIITLDDSPL